MGTGRAARYGRTGARMRAQAGELGRHWAQKGSAGRRKRAGKRALGRAGKRARGARAAGAWGGKRAGTGGHAGRGRRPGARQGHAAGRAAGPAGYALGALSLL